MHPEPALFPDDLGFKPLVVFQNHATDAVTISEINATVAENERARGQNGLVLVRPPWETVVDLPRLNIDDE